MMNEQQRLLQCIEKRCVENPGLSQTVQFFMISNQNNDLARQIWRHSAFIISLSSTKTISSSLDDEYFIPERHKQLTRKVSSGLVRLTHDDLLDLNENDNENKNESDNESDNESNSMELDLSQFPPLTQHQQVQRRGSFTTDDLNIEEFDKENKECNRHQNGGRRRFSRSYIQQFNDNVQVFKWMLDAPVGCQFETDSNSQQICDPIHENQIIQKMEVKKVFQSVARPILLETFDQNDQSIGQIIIKQGDDLRQDQNMMFMFHIMNAIWEEHRLEYNKHPIRALTYLCIPMGTDFGAIELVENCIPLRNIASLADKFETDSHLFNNLIASTVGSYIATYICGVGDRDFDNILIRKDDGTLFHIDFGYIFGQKVSMDTAEFAITNHLYSIIIGQDDNEELWEQFIDICVDAFMILRQNIDEIIAFTEIVWTFLEPSVSIKTWMNHIFAIDLMEKEAEIALRNKLEQAPFKWNTTVKNVMHSWTTSCSWYPRNNDLSVIKRLSF